MPEFTSSKSITIEDGYMDPMTPTMEETGGFEQFTLLGGPLYRLGKLLRLVRREVNTIGLGVSLGALLWIVVVTLALVEGNGEWMFSLSRIGGHVRLLLAIPLFFACESWLAPRETMFVKMIAQSGVVPQSQLQALGLEIKRIKRWSGSWMPEVVFLLLAALGSLSASYLPRFGATIAFDPSSAPAGVTVAGLWYWFVCLPLFRFLILRWIWRLGLWSYFLWRISKLQLNLVPIHPDGAAGLGYLEVVHLHFTPLVLAISAVQSASFAEEISSGTMTFESLYPAIALILLVDAALFLGPLFIFYSKLWTSRVTGLSDYMILAERYVRSFDRKWLGADTAREPLLGTADLQSLADLGNSVSVVREMRVVPISKRMLLGLAISALAPMLPLLLLKYPIAELTQKFVIRLIEL